MSEPGQGAAATDDPRPPAPPATGDPAIDTALQGVGDLASKPLSEHHDRLVQVHEALHAALEGSGDDAAGS
jgi:hypothetical protein